MSEPRRNGRSAVALLAGFALVVALSLGTGAVMHATGVLPPFGEAATDIGLGLRRTMR